MTEADNLPPCTICMGEDTNVVKIKLQNDLEDNPNKKCACTSVYFHPECFHKYVNGNTYRCPHCRKKYIISYEVTTQQINYLDREKIKKRSIIALDYFTRCLRWIACPSYVSSFGCAVGAMIAHSQDPSTDKYPAHLEELLLSYLIGICLVAIGMFILSMLYIGSISSRIKLSFVKFDIGFIDYLIKSFENILDKSYDHNHETMEHLEPGFLRDKPLESFHYVTLPALLFSTFTVTSLVCTITTLVYYLEGGSHDYSYLFRLVLPGFISMILFVSYYVLVPFLCNLALVLIQFPIGFIAITTYYVIIYPSVWLLEFLKRKGTKCAFYCCFGLREEEKYGVDNIQVIQVVS